MTFVVGVCAAARSWLGQQLQLSVRSQWGHDEACPGQPFVPLEPSCLKYIRNIHLIRVGVKI